MYGKKRRSGLEKSSVWLSWGTIDQLDFLAGRETLEGHLHCSPMANGQGESYRCNWMLGFCS